jgi:hypothetical protein
MLPGEVIQKKSSLSWDTAQHIVVKLYSRFEMTYGSHIYGFLLLGFPDPGRYTLPVRAA